MKKPEKRVNKKTLENTEGAAQMDHSKKLAT
jgi:hypothetical protein